MNGLSITVVFGKYGGFYAHFHEYSWRICLGWLAVTIYPKTDIEEFIKHLRKDTTNG